jgi:RNA-splicing ligase RtcB
MADHHKGYAVSIGGVVAYRDSISPSGEEYDISCGNKAVGLLQLHESTLTDFLRVQRK